jgi:hypothetical protein
MPVPLVSVVLDPVVVVPVVVVPVVVVPVVVWARAGPAAATARAETIGRIFIRIFFSLCAPDGPGSPPDPHRKKRPRDRGASCRMGCEPLPERLIYKENYFVLTNNAAR